LGIYWHCLARRKEWIVKKYVKLIVGVAAFVLLLIGASVLYNNLAKEYKPEANLQAVPDSAETEQIPAEQESAKVIDFTMENMAGEEITLYSLVGKPLVLNFWASWCGPCKMEMPDFEEKYLELGSELNFLMVNMTDGSRETVSIASNFIDEQGYTFPVYYDTQSSAAITYSVYSLPTTYFIDADGYIIAQASGAIDAETLQKGIDMIKED